MLVEDAPSEAVIVEYVGQIVHYPDLEDGPPSDDPAAVSAWQVATLTGIHEYVSQMPRVMGQLMAAPAALAVEALRELALVDPEGRTPEQWLSILHERLPELE